MSLYEGTDEPPPARRNETPDHPLRVPRPRACPAWCGNPHKWPELRRMHTRVVWHHIAHRDVDLSIEVCQDGGRAPVFEVGLFDPGPDWPRSGGLGYEVRLSVAQMKALRDALSETLRALAATPG
jgi:hypothetical protein